MTAPNPTQPHQSSSSSSSRHGVSKLPPELIPLILVKLPIKIIIISKCVCKSWNRLISDPYFTKFYALNSPFTAMMLLQFPQVYTIPIPRQPDFRFLQIGDVHQFIHTPFNLDPLITTTPEITQGGEFLMKRLVGSVNGLLCVVVTPFKLDDDGLLHTFFRYNSQSFFVINPLTGESIKLPQVKGGEEEYQGINCCGDHGFGSTVDGDYYKYKILRIIHTYDHINDKTLWDLKIITLGVDDEWRHLDDPAILDIDVFITDGVALNGALHRVGVQFQSDSELMFIYAFDVGKEIGCRIPCPSNGSPRGDIGVWDGRLCFVQQSENECHVWTMRQYGVADPWTKDIIVRSSIMSRLVAIPITTRRNWDLLFSVAYPRSHKIFVSFDPKTKNCVELDEAYDDRDTNSDLLEYAPCFSSLSGIISKLHTIRES